MAADTPGQAPSMSSAGPASTALGEGPSTSLPVDADFPTALLEPSGTDAGTAGAAPSPSTLLEPSAGAPGEASLDISSDYDENPDISSASSPRSLVPEAAEIPSGSVESSPDSAAHSTVATSFTTAVVLIASTVAVAVSLLW